MAQSRRVAPRKTDHVFTSPCISRDLASVLRNGRTTVLRETGQRPFMLMIQGTKNELIIRDCCHDCIRRNSPGIRERLRSALG